MNEIAALKKSNHTFMKKILLLLLVCVSNVIAAQIADVRINEVDQDQPGTDTTEFVELFGAPNTPLDGLVLVFFNGSGDASYDVYDLAGKTTDESGFFLLGSQQMAGIDDTLTYNASGSIQNGQDAIALYLGSGADWPTGTPVSSTNLVDAIVYTSGDGPDDGLTAALTPNQPILDVAGNSTSSFSRVPDGGAAFDHSAYVLQAPTPGSSNIPECWGSEVALVSGSVQQCSDTINDPIIVSNSSLIGVNYIYVLTDTNNAIITWYAESTLDMDQFEDGVYWVYGVSFNGDIDENTLTPGSNISGMMAAECLSVSTNFLEIIRETCGIEPPATTILDIVVNSDVHNTLEAAVLAAGLQGALSGPGPLTLFAPTDAAFAALPAGTIDALLADPTGLLTQILLYHVVGASALSTDLSDGQVIATLNGADVTVTINGNGVFINNAQVIVADIIADNGVVHVIDAVLLPVPSSVESAKESADSFQLFPNPTEETLFIQSESGFNQWNVRDINGRIVLSGNNLSENRMEIPVNMLEAGCYFIQINYTTNMVNTPFIKR
jgi:uncharacterized surface protein with fasciclin (FAS1) repeats